MPARLKVHQTHIGFHDLVVAALSMTAAVQAWGSNPRLFAQGFARVTQDTEAVTAALAHPGVVLRRPHGQTGAFKINPEEPAVPKKTAAHKRMAAEAARAKARQAADESGRWPKPKDAPNNKPRMSSRRSKPRKHGCVPAAKNCNASFICAASERQIRD